MRNTRIKSGEELLLQASQHCAYLRNSFKNTYPPTKRTDGTWVSDEEMRSYMRSKPADYKPNYKR